MVIKRTLTSLQIMQFLVGASYAMLHSFVSYSVPVISTGSQSAAVSAAAASAAAGSNGSASAVNGVKSAYETRIQPCITTNGATFAVWLNVLYLAPLTYLFGSFFVESYLRRSNAGAQAGKGARDRRLSNNVVMAEKAGWEAAKSVKQEVYGEEAIETENDAKTNTRKANGRTLPSHQ
jgi:hypothetical protein